MKFVQLIGINPRNMVIEYKESGLTAKLINDKDMCFIITFASIKSLYQFSQYLKRNNIFDINHKNGYQFILSEPASKDCDSNCKEFEKQQVNIGQCWKINHLARLFNENCILDKENDCMEFIVLGKELPYLHRSENNAQLIANIQCIQLITKNCLVQSDDDDNDTIPNSETDINGKDISNCNEIACAKYATFQCSNDFLMTNGTLVSANSDLFKINWSPMNKIINSHKKYSNSNGNNGKQLRKVHRERNIGNINNSCAQLCQSINPRRFGNDDCYKECAQLGDIIEISTNKTNGILFRGVITCILARSVKNLNIRVTIVKDNINLKGRSIESGRNRGWNLFLACCANYDLENKIIYFGNNCQYLKHISIKRIGNNLIELHSLSNCKFNLVNAKNGQELFHINYFDNEWNTMFNQTQNGKMQIEFEWK